MLKKIIFFACLLFAMNLIAQKDSVNLKGTIKVGKPKPEQIYIKASASYRYELDKKQANMAADYHLFQPFPVVEGHSFPFNYSVFFRDKFKNEKINLKGKSDTVNIEVKVTPKGKVYLHYKASDANDDLKVRSILFIKQIKEWQPAYIIVPQKGKYKKQTVIKPEKVNVTAIGVITIIFSTEDLEN